MRVRAGFERSAGESRGTAADGSRFEVFTLNAKKNYYIMAGSHGASNLWVIPGVSRFGQRFGSKTFYVLWRRVDSNKESADFLRRRRSYNVLVKTGVPTVQTDPPNEHGDE